MKPIIIAEAGVNHNGDFDMACRMVEEAKKAGADYVKFQTFKAENLVTEGGEAAEYQKQNCNADSQFEMLKKLELSFDRFALLAQYCKEVGIGFLSTPFDFESIDFLASLEMDYMKVPSGEITNLPYLRRIASTGIPVIISTGMSTAEDITDALKPFYAAGYESDRLILLHCTTQYPTPMRDVNLKAMLTLRELFGLQTGYSDHTEGIEISLAAAALGACVIEKHFTLDRRLPGPDHKASIEPHELASLVKKARNISEALGSEKKFVTDSEKANIKVARKSIVASRPIRKGEILTENNLTVKRPGTGISPMKWDEVIGRKAIKNFMKDDEIIL